MIHNYMNIIIVVANEVVEEHLVKNEVKVGMTINKTRKIRKRQMVIVPPLSRKIHPGNDFYQFVNSNWLIKVNMPPSESSFGVSEEIEQNIRRQLLRQIYRLIITPNQNYIFTRRL